MHERESLNVINSEKGLSPVIGMAGEHFMKELSVEDGCISIGKR